jgi:hypothetical protein
VGNSSPHRSQYPPPPWQTCAQSIVAVGLPLQPVCVLHPRNLRALPCPAAVGAPPAPAADPPGRLPPLPPAAAGLEDAAVAVPRLEDLGYPSAGSTPFKGGEAAALARMAGEQLPRPSRLHAALNRPACSDSLAAMPAHGG